MQGTDRKLVNPPVSSRDAFAEIDARKEAEVQAALEQECDRREEAQRLARADRASGTTPC